MSRLRISQGRYDGAIEMKRKLYSQIILLINYMTEENLFVYVERSSVKHAGFLSEKKSHTHTHTQ